MTVIVENKCVKNHQQSHLRNRLNQDYESADWEKNFILWLKSNVTHSIATIDESVCLQKREKNTFQSRRSKPIKRSYCINHRVYWLGIIEYKPYGMNQWPVYSMMNTVILFTTGNQGHWRKTRTTLQWSKILPIHSNSLFLIELTC